MDGEVAYNSLPPSAIETAKTREPDLTKLKSRLPPDTPQALRRSIKLATNYIPEDQALLCDLRSMMQFFGSSWFQPLEDIGDADSIAIAEFNEIICRGLDPTEDVCKSLGLD